MAAWRAKLMLAVLVVTEVILGCSVEEISGGPRQPEQAAPAQSHEADPPRAPSAQATPAPADSSAEARFLRWTRPGPMPAGGDWNGVFHSRQYGDLHVVVEGSVGRGTWRSQQSFGELSGPVDGDIWHYSWTERIGTDATQERNGRGYFRYKIEGRDSQHVIKGEWGLGDKLPGNSWEAVKQNHDAGVAP